MSSPLLDQMRAVIRLRHYSIRTEEAYLNVIRHFIFYHQKRHPKEMGVSEIRQYLSHLATDRNVSASTQNQALSALLFLYREVFQIELPLIAGIERAKRPQRVPVVLTVEESRRVLTSMSGTQHLMASLLYGAGLRLMECVRLRVKDIDFDYRQIIVRDGKGEKDRRTILPTILIEPLRRHLARVHLQHQEDVRGGYGASICLTLWSVNTQTLPPIGSGNTSFQPPSSPLTRALKSGGGITLLKTGYRRLSSEHFNRQQ
jgi:site-specific recombinase XerD